MKDEDFKKSFNTTRRVNDVGGAYNYHSRWWQSKGDRWTRGGREDGAIRIGIQMNFHLVPFRSIRHATFYIIKIRMKELFVSNYK